MASQPSPGAKYTSPEQPGLSAPGLRSPAQADDCELTVMIQNDTEAARSKERCSEGETRSLGKSAITTPPQTSRSSLSSLPGLGWAIQAESRPGRAWLSREQRLVIHGHPTLAEQLPCAGSGAKSLSGTLRLA